MHLPKLLIDAYSAGQSGIGGPGGCMRCPFCGNIDTQVKDSRPAEDHVSIRRRRFCPACGGRFTTYERVQLRDLVVVKKNGRREPFDRDKLERSIRIAMQKRPIESERLDQMISGIVRRLESMGETDIPSDTIGAIVMETLARIDTVAYVRFASVYKNFQAADDFEDFVSELRPAAARPRRGLSDHRGRRGVDAHRARSGAARAGPGLAQSGGRLPDRGGRDRGRARLDRRRRHAPRRDDRARPGGHPRPRSHRLRDARALQPQGRTPPCTGALIAAGVARVVVAIEDPDPRVNGAGVAALRAAGIAVEVGCLAAEAVTVNRGFLRRIAAGRPVLTLKLATSLDGRIATGTGESRWITGPRARAEVHLIRAQADAILVGAGTVRSDDPRLDVRDLGIADSNPVRVVVSGSLALPRDGHLARTADQAPLWLFHDSEADDTRRRAWSELGADLIEIPFHPDGQLDLSAMMQRLGERGITRVLCEGGGQLAAALLHADLVDELVCYTAGLTLGAEAIPRSARSRLPRCASPRTSAWLTWPASAPTCAAVGDANDLPGNAWRRANR